MKGYVANVLADDVIDRKKEVGSPPYALGGGLFVLYGDRSGVTLHLAATDENDAERRIIAKLGPDAVVDDIGEIAPPRDDSWRVTGPPRTTCTDCGKELSEEDLRSTDPRRCDSCEQARAYDRASADVVLPLSNDEAEFIADNLHFLAGIDEGDNTDYDELVRVSTYVRGFLEPDVG